MTITGFVPEWASPTAETILDLLADRGIAASRFAEVVGLDSDDAARLRQGLAPLTIKTAERLVDTLGSSVEFWMERDGQYHEDRNRLEDRDWVDRFPSAFLLRNGWVRTFDGWADEIVAVREFFDVANGRDWETRYRPMMSGASLHQSDVHKLQKTSLAVWLRRAEQVVADHDADAWSADALLDSVGELRALTRIADPERFVPAARAVLAPAGVVLAVVRTPPKCPVSGAASVLGDGRRMVVLSGRHLADDQLWFAFFHEIGHLMLHKDAAVCEDPTAIGDVEEAEASQFAAETLLPNLTRTVIPDGAIRKRDVIRAAAAARTSPGVVLGQLQFAGKVPHGRLNTLKRRYLWEGDRLVAKPR